ncbi:hypothetical protein M3Y98_00066200 [Aphelenchoides besseyi]|nr:hypothetical protein M3Y98_00066200 [Aphelenchoides besseyi]KAI6198804.1 hypothetical protein M3Y96_00558200 [Aphelenchoides besseyi]
MGFGTLGWSTTAQTCACGLNVHKGALIVGIILLISHSLKSIDYIRNLINGTYDATYEMEFEAFKHLKPRVGPTTTVSTLILSLVGVLVTGLMIYGNRSHRRSFVRPFIIFKKIACWLLISGGIFLILAALLLLILGPRRYASVAFQYSVVAAVFLLIGIFKLYFCVVVVKRSYNLMSPLDDIA